MVCWKIDLLCQIVKLWIQRKSSSGILKCYSSENTNEKKAKQTYCWYGESCSDLDRSNQPQHFLRAKTNPEQSSTLFNSMKADIGEEVAKERFEINKSCFIRFKEKNMYVTQNYKVKQQVLR